MSTKSIRRCSPSPNSRKVHGGGLRSQMLSPRRLTWIWHCTSNSIDLVTLSQCRYFVSPVITTKVMKPLDGRRRALTPSGDSPIQFLVQIQDGLFKLRRQTVVLKAHRVQTLLLAFDVAEVLAGDKAPMLDVLLVERPKQLRTFGFFIDRIRGQRPDIEEALLRIVHVGAHPVAQGVAVHGQHEVVGKYEDLPTPQPQVFRGLGHGYPGAVGIVVECL